MPSKRVKDLTGQKFGGVEIISFSSIYKGNAYWNCKCSCGKEFITRGGHLKTGLVKSCGHLRRDHMSILGKRKIIYSFNHDYFSIPNPINSYWAGFIAADGFIRNSKYGTGTLSIGISSKDRVILERFCDCIDLDKIYIKEYTNKANIYSNHERFRSSLTLTSNKFRDDLFNNYNITTKKSLTLKPPQNLNLENSLSYICGYIDGDGYIGKPGNKSLVLVVLSTEEVLKWIKDIFFSFNLNRALTIKKHSNYYTLYVSTDCILRLYKYIREYKLPLLDRKWDNVKIIFNLDL